MGRIAEALKKARQEREEKLCLGLGAPRGSRASHPTGTVELGRDAREVTARDFNLRGARVAQKQESPPRPMRRGASLRHHGPLMGPMPPWEAHPSVIALRDRSSAITEQYRAVRTWMLSHSTSGEHCCLAITSSVPREGKSVTVANLSVVMAEARHLRVLAVDTDFRQGYLARLFQQPNTPGLADVLAGRLPIDACIAETPLGNLDLLPAGTYQDLNSAELLNSTLAARVFDEIRERYHFVLVDTPPVQWLSDVGVIGALCTGIVMVVRMNKTPADVVRQSVHWLQSNNLNVVGCIAAACSQEAARSGYRERNGDD